LSKKIILLAGPTASGKSKLAIHLANKLNGEIINADSMQVYKEFSILSSRPNKKEIRQAKHYLYGLISVKKYFSAGDWLKEAKKKIDNVYKSWDLMKIYTNPYEFIHTNIPKHTQNTQIHTKCTSSGSSIAERVQIICAGCCSSGRERIKAATSSAVFHFDN